jgi:ABC-type lipoprotein release transport system permease subunit
MGAVGIGLLLVIFYGGLMDSMLGEAKEQLDNVGMGHVEITATNWRAQHRVTDGLEAPGELLNRLDLPAGSEAGYRVVTRGLISSARGSEGVELQGVDWNQEERLSLYVRDVRQGQRPAPDDERGMLIGEKLAQRLHVDVGAKVRIMVQRADGEIGAELYRVRGLFHSMSPAISQRRVLVSASSARNLLGVENVGHQVVIQLEHAAAADHEAQRLREKLGTKFFLLYGPSNE